MTLRELENIMINILADANVMRNTQYGMIISSTINMLKSIENLSSGIYSSLVNDSCKNLMIQKMAELDSYTTQAVLMRIAEMGLDVSVYSGYRGMNTTMPQMMNPIMQMPQQPIMQMPQPIIQPPVQPMAAPVPPAPAPVAPVMPATPPPTPPANANNNNNNNNTGGGINIGLPGMGKNDGPAEGRDYLLKIINGE